MPIVIKPHDSVIQKFIGDMLEDKKYSVKNISDDWRNSTNQLVVVLEEGVDDAPLTELAQKSMAKSIEYKDDPDYGRVACITW